jgi:hypothetical protein
VPRELVAMVAGLLRAERRARGTGPEQGADPVGTRRCWCWSGTASVRR